MPNCHDDIPTQWIPLPDGTRLCARIWLPHGASETPVPAVLEFLPYRRRDATSARDASVYPAFAAMGIAGVRVDLRGTGDSDGHFDDEYSETELSDAEATIAWIAAQEWCNGRVGMMGISWGGFNALQVAARRPPALKAVISIASTVDRFSDDIHYKGGAQLSANLYWATQMLGRAAQPPDKAVVGDTWRDIWLDRLEHLPALILPWLEHGRRDAYWQHGSICEDFSALEAPALTIAGWADGYRNTPWDARAGLVNRARSITGPWVHLYPHFAVPEPRLDFMAEAGRWWGQWLKGEETGAEALPAHRLYLSEAVRPDKPRTHEPGRWIEITQDGGSDKVLYLHPDRLSEDPPSATAVVTVKTPLDCGTGGGEFFTQGADADLPGDQRTDDGMSVCFETPVLEAPLDVIGRPVLHLPVALDAPQGKLVARLVDVHPDGVSHRISLGILNLSHRAGSAAPTTMEPGESEVVSVTLDTTAYRVLPGHRLRLAVSTVYFPMILPPPTDVTATLSLTDQARLHLPSCPFTEITLPLPGPDTRPDYPRHSPPSAARTVTHDRGSGRTTVAVQTDTGRTEQTDHGMIWQDRRITEVGITRGDALSYTAEETCIGRRERDGVVTEVTAQGWMEVSETHWIASARVVATEDGTEVFRRDWNERIPRDHM